MTLFGIPAYQAWLLMGLACFCIASVATTHMMCDAEAVMLASQRSNHVLGRWEAAVSTAGVILITLAAGPLGVIGLLNPRLWRAAPTLFLGREDGDSEFSSLMKTWVVVRNSDNQYVRDDGTLSFRVRSARVMPLAEAKRSFPDFKAIPLSYVVTLHPDYL